MIIWIDGTYGVGKTSVTLVLEKILKKRNIEVLLSDSFFLKWLHKKFCGGGTLPQNNVQFIEYFRDIIEGKIEKEIIIDMSLTQHECKEMLYDYFNDKSVEFRHFILVASEKTITSRINKSKNRDAIALSFLQENINFLKENYKDAIIIDTENKSVKKIAKEILKKL